MIRGQKIYYNTGELSFETCPQTAGTFQGTFLEKVNDHIKILDKNGKLKMVHKSLISIFNI
jgi:hypothetical protein